MINRKGLLQTYANSLKLRVALAIAAMALGWTMVLLLPGNRLIPLASYACFAFLSVSLVVLPPVLAAVGVVLLALVFGGFAYISRVKTALTELPLTSMDLKVAILNPDGLIGAMQWTRVEAYSIALVALGIIALIFIRLSHAHIKRDRQGFIAASFCFLLFGSASFASVNNVSDRIYDAVRANPQISDDLWEPNGLVKLAQRTGATAFLWMTSRVDGSAGNSLFFSTPEKVADPEALRRDYLTYAKEMGGERPVQPNVVVMLLESTMDVGKVFDIVPEVETTLREDDDSSLLHGSFAVNAVGGGTWITEFEVMTGINSRLFGYAGYYTHVSLSPYVINAFPERMRKQGYETIGFYSAPGKFYGTGTAYGRYGIEHVIDSESLGIADPWSMKDDALIEAYLTRLPNTNTRPFLAYMATMENHAPHHCVPQKWKTMPYAFKQKARMEMNCQLNEYILRLRSTERAVAQVERHLQTLQTQTGRPYLLVIYGDHQPHTFVGTGGNDWSPYDYGDLRRTPKDRTFYQIRGSVLSPFRSRSLDISSFTMPTIISMFLASGNREIYMPENLRLLKKCGAQTKIVGREGLGAMHKAETPVFEGPCATAVAMEITAVRAKHWRH